MEVRVSRVVIPSVPHLDIAHRELRRPGGGPMVLVRGDMVIIEGLQSRADLNGMCAAPKKKPRKLVVARSLLRFG